MPTTMTIFQVGSQKMEIFFLFIACLIFLPKTSAITCSICGQSNLTAPGECTNQFQYDCQPNPTSGGQQLNQPQSAINGEQKQQPKILCRTTRTKLGENQFAVIKECVTENEHLNRYPDGKAFGCDTVRSNSTFPTTYCVCDQDLCNARSLDEQLSQPQPPVPNNPAANVRPPTTPIEIDPSQAQAQLAIQSPRLPLPTNQINRTVLVGNQNQPDPQQVVLNPQLLQIQNARGLPLGPQQSIVPPQPIDEFSVPANPINLDPNQLAPNPSLSQEPPPPADQASKRSSISSQPPQSNQPSSRPPRPSGTTQLHLVALNTERVEFITDSTPAGATTTRLPTNSSRKATPQNAFVCMVCHEGNITSTQDCQIQNPLDCRGVSRPGANLFCLTKATTVATGQSQIEKRCASEEELSQELGLSTVQAGCFSGQDSRLRVDYCICSTSKCNQLPLANQANMYPPLTPNDRVGTSTPGQQHSNPSEAAPAAAPQTKMCYVCGESDQAQPSDCTQQYEYDCTRQYPQGSTILCLTRQTKMASGRFNIEKRCITPAEHQLQYPDNEVTLNGCNEGWNGYIQYCVCQGDFCNRNNITLQQQAHHWVPKPVEIPDEETFEIEDQRNPQPDPSAVAVPRLPNGLLAPPSTRLPLSPSQTTPTNLTIAKTDRTGGQARGVNNSVQESIPPSSPTTVAETPNPWDSRIRHEGHRPSSTENTSKADQKKKPAPTPLRRGGNNVGDDGDPYRDKATTTLPGFLNVLALIVLTILKMH